LIELPPVDVEALEAIMHPPPRFIESSGWGDDFFSDDDLDLGLFQAILLIVLLVPLLVFYKGVELAGRFKQHFIESPRQSRIDG
jgi:hypothetical protein